MMHVKKLQPNPFEILACDCVADQELVLIGIFNRNQVLLYGYWACSSFLKADVVDIKGRCRIIGAFDIDRQIFAAYTVIAVASLKFHPTVAGADGFGGKGHIIRAASTAGLCRQLEL
ncbi:hypothetical protein D3C75_830740 [compost metagenome]